MKSWIAVAGGVGGMLLVGFALFARKSPEERVGETLDRLEVALTLDGQTTNPIFAKARFDEAFEEVFTEDVAYRIPELTSGSHGRSSLTSLATGATRYVTTLDVDLAGRDIVVAEGGKSATVRARAVVVGIRGSGPERDERQVVFDLVDTDGEFLIERVRVYPPGEAE